MILFKLISRLPFRFIYLLSDLLAFFVEHIFQYRRKVIIKNLKNSFPDKSPREIRKIKSRYYKNLTDIALETIKLISISAEELNKRVKVLNSDMVNALYEKNTSAIVTTAHLYNWEWMLALMGIHLKAPIDAVYQEIKNQFFDRLMIRIRSRFGAIPVERNQIFRESLKKRNSPHLAAIVADQSPPLHDENVIWIRFLNQDTAFYSGIARMARTFKWPVVFIDMRRIKRGWYEMEYKDVCTTPENTSEEEILKNYAHRIEESIGRCPHCWLWSHNRWKKEKK